MLRPNGSLVRHDIILIKCAACGANVCINVHEIAKLCIEKMDAHAKTHTTATAKN